MDSSHVNPLASVTGNPGLKAKGVGLTPARLRLPKMSVEDDESPLKRAITSRRIWISIQQMESLNKDPGPTWGQT